MTKTEKTSKLKQRICITTILDKELWKEFRIKAIRKEITTSQAIIEAIKLYIN